MNRHLRIGLVAGEASGDVLGARLIEALQQRVPGLEVIGVGGPHLIGCGLESLYPMDRLSVMGFAEPLLRLPELLRLRRRLRRQFLNDPPDVFIGIDSPDFNLPLERRLRAGGVPTVHLVSPSVWAWRRGRLPAIARSTDLMLCLFPFELPIYREAGIPAAFVGHPRADELRSSPDQLALRRQLGLPQAGRILALLPGSRESEIRRLAPAFLQTAQQLHDNGCAEAFVLPVANAACRAALQPLLQAHAELPLVLVEGQSCDAMAAADVVLTASGTATLEAALLRRPMVVAYRTGTVTWQFLSRLVHTECVALPNILAGKQLVPEFLQSQASVTNLLPAVRDLLMNSAERDATVQAFDVIAQDLRQGFGTVAAQAVLQLLEHPQV